MSQSTTSLAVSAAPSILEHLKKIFDMDQKFGYLLLGAAWTYGVGQLILSYIKERECTVREEIKNKGKELDNHRVELEIELEKVKNLRLQKSQEELEILLKEELEKSSSPEVKIACRSILNLAQSGNVA